MLAKFDLLNVFVAVFILVRNVYVYVRQLRRLKSNLTTNSLIYRLSCSCVQNQTTCNNCSFYLYHVLYSGKHLPQFTSLLIIDFRFLLSEHTFSHTDVATVLFVLACVAAIIQDFVVFFIAVIESKDQTKSLGAFKIFHSEINNWRHSSVAFRNQTHRGF